MNFLEQKHQAMKTSYRIVEYKAQYFLLHRLCLWDDQMVGRSTGCNGNRGWEVCSSLGDHLALSPGAGPSWRWLSSFSESPRLEADSQPDSISGRPRGFGIRPPPCGVACKQGRYVLQCNPSVLLSGDKFVPFVAWGKNRLQGEHPVCWLQSVSLWGPGKGECLFL